MKANRSNDSASKVHLVFEKDTVAFNSVSKYMSSAVCDDRTLLFDFSGF